jgi:hypothetical protein
MDLPSSVDKRRDRKFGCGCELSLSDVLTTDCSVDFDSGPQGS